jgi:hypothetical protein
MFFSGRVYIYHEDLLLIEQEAECIKAFRGNRAISVQFRGIDYMLAVWQIIKSGARKPAPKYVIKDELPEEVP